MRQGEAVTPRATRHVLSLSGGKDSAALAIYMRDRVADMEYIFHDTEKELPETYEFLDRLEAILGKQIVRTSPDVTFDRLLKEFGGVIPSSRRRWCTRYLKLKPFERYVGDDPVVNYVGIRADEPRKGYISHKPNITAVYPFREDGLVLQDIYNILEESGIGLPTFTRWGRTRSGCFFCFFQQKIEWVRLMETYPDLFEEAKKYEYANKLNGNAFYWSGNESLEELARPERVAEIRRKWEEANASQKESSGKPTLMNILGKTTAVTEERQGCLICSL